MKKTELLQLMLLITNCYPNFQATEEKILIWFELMKNTPIDLAKSNLLQHLKSNSFIPTPADIIKETQVDKEIESRNHDIAFSQFVRGGGKPEDFIYVRDRAAGVKELGS